MILTNAIQKTVLTTTTTTTTTVLSELWHWLVRPCREQGSGKSPAGNTPLDLVRLVRHAPFNVVQKYTSACMNPTFSLKLFNISEQSFDSKIMELLTKYKKIWIWIMHFLCRNYAFFYLDSNITIKGPIGVLICILSRKMSEVSVFGFRYENTTLQ